MPPADAAPEMEDTAALLKHAVMGPPAIAAMPPQSLLLVILPGAGAMINQAITFNGKCSSLAGGVDCDILECQVFQNSIIPKKECCTAFARHRCCTVLG